MGFHWKLSKHSKTTTAVFGLKILHLKPRESSALLAENALLKSYGLVHYSLDTIQNFRPRFILLNRSTDLRLPLVISRKSLPKLTVPIGFLSWNLGSTSSIVANKLKASEKHRPVRVKEDLA